jgi:hypothetical protein
VARGPVATIEIGAEVKILAKAMIKQIDRVTGDLKKQVSEFKYRSGDYEPICVGIVGINFAPVTTGYEGDRSYRTDGAKHKHPYQEAPEAQRRLMAHAAPAYDEFLVLRYKATNEPPYPFEWVDYTDTVQEYGAILTRISRAYERRFATEYSTARKDSGPAVEAKPRVVVSHSPSGLTVTNYGPRLFGVNFKSRPAEDMVVKFEPVPALAESASVPLTFSIVSTDGKTNFACGLEVVALAAPHSMVPVIITCQDGQRRWWEGVGALVFDQTARQWNSAGFDEMRELPMS